MDDLTARYSRRHGEPQAGPQAGRPAGAVLPDAARPYAARPYAPTMPPPEPYRPVPHIDGFFGTADHSGAGLGTGAREPGWWTVRRRTAAMAAAVLLALGGGAAGAVTTLAVTGSRTVDATTTATVSGTSTASSMDVAKVAAAVKPSIVSITAESGQSEVEGSGVIIRSSGMILTNAHVVSQASRLTVKFSDGRTAQARLVGSDTAKDIAVIKAQGVSGLRPATLGDSDGLAVGDPVVAIGSPLGLSGSVTYGIVSALDRQISESRDEQQPGFAGQAGSAAAERTVSIDDAVQTDAAINPGNSGGALVNASGQVVGITTAIATTSSDSGNIGVGFAIPIDSAASVAARLMSS